MCTYANYKTTTQTSASVMSDWHWTTYIIISQSSKHSTDSYITCHIARSNVFEIVVYHIISYRQFRVQRCFNNFNSLKFIDLFGQCSRSFPIFFKLNLSSSNIFTNYKVQEKGVLERDKIILNTCQHL